MDFANLYYGDMIDRAHPLNRGLLAEDAVVPWYASGLRLIDLCGAAGTHNHGTLTNGPTWVGALGRPGGCGAIKFVSASSQYIEGTIPAGLSATAEWTIACWFFAAPLPANSIFFCIGRDSGAGAGNGMALGINNGDGSGTGSTFVGLLPNVAWLNTSVTLTASTWYQAALTRVGTTITAYLNGVPAGSTFSSTPADFDASARVRISGQTSNSGRYFDGLSDGQIIHNRALSASEVFMLYNETRRGNPARWRRVSTRTWFGVTAAASFNPGWATGATRGVLGTGVL